MKSIMVITLVLVVVAVLVKAQDDDGPRGPPRELFDEDGPGGPGGPGGPRGPPRRWFGQGGPRGHGGKHGSPISILEAFSACANMAQAMREKHDEMMRNHQIGPKSCRGIDDFRACWRRSLETVRCAVAETPSDDCMDQVSSFMKGDMCNNATTENSSVNDYESTIA